MRRAGLARTVGPSSPYRAAIGHVKETARPGRDRAVVPACSMSSDHFRGFFSRL